MLLKRIIRYIKRKLLGTQVRRSECGLFAPTAQVAKTVRIYSPKNFYIEENSCIGFNSVIMNTRAKFKLMSNSVISFNFCAITGDHMLIPGFRFPEVTDMIKDERDVEHKCDQDIVIEEDVWIGCNVTVLKGVRIGRGAVIGAGTIVRKDIPPYAIVAGNPAKVVRFKFTIEDILAHEQELYPIEERIPSDILIDNYNNYYLTIVR